MEDNYKPDKDFTDHAWANMKALLDKEMPEAAVVVSDATTGKSKRWLLLLLLLFLLGLLTAGAIYYQEDKQIVSTSTSEVEKPTITSTKNVEETITTESQNTEVSTNAVVTTPTEDKVVVSKSSNQTSLSTKKPKAVQDKTFKKYETTEQLEERVQEAETPLYFFEEKNATDTDERAEKALAMNEQTKKEQIADTTDELKNVSLEDDNLITQVDFIATRKVDLLPIMDEDILKDKKTKISCALESHLAAVLGVRSYDFEIQPNLVLGVESIVRKANHKLGLRGGAYYAQRNSNFLINEKRVASLTINDLEDAFSAVEVAEGDFNVFDSDRRAIERQEKSLYHFLDVSLMADYKASDKWSIFGGGQTSLLLYSATRNFGLFDFSNNLDAVAAEIPSNTSEVGVEGVNRTSVFAPRKVNLAAQLGVDYRLNPRLSLSAKYSENLLDTYPEITGNQRSRFVEVGMKWWLK